MHSAEHEMVEVIVRCCLVDKTAALLLGLALCSNRGCSPAQRETTLTRPFQSSQRVVSTHDERHLMDHSIGSTRPTLERVVGRALQGVWSCQYSVLCMHSVNGRLDA
jgi:hypothetical protein